MNYTVSVVSEDQTIVAGEGPARVLYYLANVGVEALEEIGDEKEATVQVFHGDTKILAVTIDAESAAGLLKARVMKVRRALAAEAGSTAE